MLTYSRLRRNQLFYKAAFHLKQKRSCSCCIASKNARTRRQVFHIILTICEVILSFLLVSLFSHCCSTTILMCCRQIIILFLKTCALEFIQSCKFYRYLLIFKIFPHLRVVKYQVFLSICLCCQNYFYCTTIIFWPKSTLAPSDRF